MLNKGAFGGVGYRGYRGYRLQRPPGDISGLRSAEPNIHGAPSSIGNHGNLSNRTPSVSPAGYRGYRGYRLQRLEGNISGGRHAG